MEQDSGLDLGVDSDIEILTPLVIKVTSHWSRPSKKKIREKWHSIIQEAKAQLMLLGMRHRVAVYARWLRTVSPEIRQYLLRPHSADSRKSPNYNPTSSQDSIGSLSQTSVIDLTLSPVVESSSFEDNGSPEIVFLGTGTRKRSFSEEHRYWNKLSGPETREFGCQTDNDSLHKESVCPLPFPPPKRPNCPCLCFCAERESGCTGPTPANRLCVSIFPDLTPSKRARLDTLITTPTRQTNLT